MPDVVTEIQISPVTLRVPWRDAAKEIHAHLKIGRAIKNQKIRDQWELDHARAEKAEWIRRTSELLNRVFTTEEVAEQATQYIGAVLPEYAEFDLFTEQFEDEMRHRLGRLQSVLKQLDTLPEAVPSTSGESAEPSAPDYAIDLDAEDDSDEEKLAAENLVNEKLVEKGAEKSAARSQAVAIVAGVPGATSVAAAALVEVPLPKNNVQPEAQDIHIAQMKVMEEEMSTTATAPAVSVNVKTNHEPQPVVNVPRIVPAAAAAAAGTQAQGLLILATHDETCRKALGEFLSDLGFKIEIVDRIAQPGRSVADLLGPDSAAGFVVIAADAASLKDTSGEWQYELGFCAGRLGAGRICVASATSETLSDKHGIRHLGIDNNGGWQLQMARYLKRAGVGLDLNRLC